MAAPITPNEKPTARTNRGGLRFVFDDDTPTPEGTGTAARDLVDTLCGEHNIPLMVLHDFDKAGFSIVGTLQRDTRRYSFRNNINVIDFGLRMADIDGLETEDVLTQSPDKARWNLLENGATEEEIEFLLDQRVELNAFASDDLVEWIEGKLGEHGVAKVIPDEDCLVDAYRRALEQAFVQQKIDDVIDEAEKLGEDAEIPKGLRAKVEERLEKDSAATWDEIVRDLAVQEIDDDDVGDDE